MVPFCVSKEVCLPSLQSQQTCDFLPRTAFYNKKAKLIKVIVLENMLTMHLYLLFPVKRPPGAQWQGGLGCRWLYCSEARHGNCRVNTDTLCILEKFHRMAQDLRLTMAESPRRASNCSSKQGSTWVADQSPPGNTQPFAHSNRPLLSARETPRDAKASLSFLQSLTCTFGISLQSVTVPSQEDINGGKGNLLLLYPWHSLRLLLCKT